MSHADPDETVVASPESHELGHSGPAELSTVTSQESGTPGLRKHFDLNDAPGPLAALHLREGVDDAPPDVSTRMISSWTDDISAGQVIGLHHGTQWCVGKVMSVNQDAGNAEFDWADCRSSSDHTGVSDCGDSPAFEHLPMSSAVDGGEDKAKIAFHSPRGKSAWDGIPMATREDPGGLKRKISEQIRPLMTTRTAEPERKLATPTAASVASAETILRSNWILSNALTDHPNSGEGNEVDTEIADAIKGEIRDVDSASPSLHKLHARRPHIERMLKALHLPHCMSPTGEAKDDSETPMEANSAPSRCPVAMDSKEFMGMESERRWLRMLDCVSAVCEKNARLTEALASMKAKINSQAEEIEVSQQDCTRRRNHRRLGEAPPSVAAPSSEIPLISKLNNGKGRFRPMRANPPGNGDCLKPSPRELMVTSPGIRRGDFCDELQQELLKWCEESSEEVKETVECTEHQTFKAWAQCLVELRQHFGDSEILLFSKIANIECMVMTKTGARARAHRGDRPCARLCFFCETNADGEGKITGHHQPLFVKRGRSAELLFNPKDPQLELVEQAAQPKSEDQLSDEFCAADKDARRIIRGRLSQIRKNPGVAPQCMPPFPQKETEGSSKAGHNSSPKKKKKKTKKMTKQHWSHSPPHAAHAASAHIRSEPAMARAMTVPSSSVRRALVIFTNGTAAQTEKKLDESVPALSKHIATFTRMKNKLNDGHRIIVVANDDAGLRALHDSVSEIANMGMKVAKWLPVGKRHGGGGLNGKVALSHKLTLDEKLDVLFLVDTQFPLNKTAAPKTHQWTPFPTAFSGPHDSKRGMGMLHKSKASIVQAGLHDVWIAAEASTPILLHAAHWPCAGDPLHDQARNEFTVSARAVMPHHKSVLSAGDFNARLSSDRDTTTNPQGSKVLEAASALGLLHWDVDLNVLCGPCSREVELESPTGTIMQRSTPDHGFCNEAAALITSDTHVSPHNCLSDHRPLVASPAVTASPNLHLVSGSWDNTIKIWR
eukprot:jgi/Bigna1/78356/fgenesh1_pg.54_\